MSAPSLAARALAAIVSSLLGVLLSGALSGALRTPVDRVGAAVRESALLAPLALPLALALVPLAALASDARIARALAWHDRTAARARALRSLAMVLPATVIAWIALAARAGAFFITAFHHVGLAAFAQAVALAGLACALAVPCALACAAVSSRLPEDPRERGRWRDPRGAWALGALLAALLVAVGTLTGDVHGRGGLLGAFGVLKKPELDLNPALVPLGALLFASGSARVLARRRSLTIAAALLAVGLTVACGRETALRFERSPAGAILEGRAGLPRVILRALRKRADRDRDGASALFGGGDCDDRDPRRSPDARDLPANGVDEDCSGADAPAPVRIAPPPPPPPSLRERIARTLPREANLLFITVDTLRWDLHYAGNPRELSPNLDRLAARGVVFDRAYAMSSYTGRSIGPLMTGRYPSECARDDNHFVRYPDAGNVFLAERLRARGFRTAMAASHFYFERRFGLLQGIERADLSATPAGEAGESVSTDARVADRAIAMLSDPAFTAGRFMLWAHFFDPHKQYVLHPEIPPFSRTERGRYDAEVAFTDRQIGRLLDALARSPFADRTVVVVTADHGEAFNEHNMSWHGVELWEELVRVPWILAVPGLAPRRIETPRGHVDLLPTVLELLSLPAPAAEGDEAVSGVSLVPELFGAPATPRPIYLELPEGPFNGTRRGLIDFPYKLLVRNPRRPELFDLRADPGERADLSSTDPITLARVRGVYEQLRGSLREVRQIETGGGGS